MNLQLVCWGNHNVENELILKQQRFYKDVN